MFMLQYLLELVGSKIFLTGYVTGNSTFPKPLNEKEEKIYLERLKDGDVEAKTVEAILYNFIRWIKKNGLAREIGRVL